MRSDRSILTDLIDGAVAGVVATWVMGKVTTFLYEKEDPVARQREESARHGRTAFGAAAERLADLAGTTLSDEQRQTFGKRIHWALGASAGALYGVLRDRLPDRALARGLTFGTLFWLVVDEGANPALGFTPGPTAFPWQAHARGLAGHLAYGTVADATLDLLARA